MLCTFICLPPELNLLYLFSSFSLCHLLSSAKSQPFLITTLVSFAVLCFLLTLFFKPQSIICELNSHHALSPRTICFQRSTKSRKRLATKIFRHPFRKTIQAKGPQPATSSPSQAALVPELHLLENIYYCIAQDVQQAFRCVDCGVGHGRSCWA